jgi:biotin carboxyl carrier protein
MGKERFIFNAHTLRYEKLVEPLKERLKRAFRFLSTALVTAVLMLVLLYKFFPSPREKQLLTEIDQMKYKYQTIGTKFDQMSKVLDNVQKRDAGVHREMFGMNPIDAAVWNGGTGGADEYSELGAFKNSEEVVRAALEKADRIQRQLALQSKSLDTIQELANSKENMFASLPSIKPVREDKLNRDIDLLSGFGWRLHPIHKIMKMHAGIDFSSPQGTQIQATGQGRVVKAEWGGGYGNHVVIDHGYGFETLYGHMSKILVKEGDRVHKGQKIGLVGSTGASTAPHCHYEVHLKGVPVNPISYCMDGLNPAQYQKLSNAANSPNQSFD